MVTVISFFLSEYMADAEFIPVISLVAVVSGLVNGVLWFGLIPMLIMRITKPVSRTGLYIRMLVYTLLITLCGAAFAYGYYTMAANEGVFTYEGLELMRVIYIAHTLLPPLIFAPIACFVFANTRFVDKKMPARFRGIHTVKATVIQTEPITAVEYEGKRYELSKCFNTKLRDKIKVRIREDEEKGYLK